MTQWLQDFRYAVRSVARRPLYAVVTIAVLAIAIGANTTVFSVLNGLFLRPLPYPDGDRLVAVYDSYPKVNLDNAGTAIPDYLERREQARSLDSLAWAVMQRFAEIGVRLALGAQARDIMRMVLAEGSRMIGLGLAIGLAGALVLGRALAAQIPGVSAFDPIVIAMVLVGLGVAALVASWLPARHASRTDPLQALREE